LQHPAMPSTPDGSHLEQEGSFLLQGKLATAIVFPYSHPFGWSVIVIHMCLWVSSTQWWMLFNSRILSILSGILPQPGSEGVRSKGLNDHKFANRHVSGPKNGSMGSGCGLLGVTA
jgi:hypothetical protein